MVCNKTIKDFTRVIFTSILFLGVFSTYGAAAKPQIVILANSIDWPLATEFTNRLENKGFEVVHTTYPYLENYKQNKRIIILGGPDAPEMVGTVVNSLLTDAEKTFLRSGTGNKKQYVLTNVWTTGQTIRVIAGNGREDTKKHSETVESEIVQEPVEEQPKEAMLIPTVACSQTQTNKLSVSQFRLLNIEERVDTSTKIVISNNSEFKLFLLLEKPSDTEIKDLKFELSPSSGIDVISDTEKIKKEVIRSNEKNYLMLGEPIPYLQEVGLYKLFQIKALKEGQQNISIKITYNADGKNQTLCRSRNLEIMETQNKLKIRLLNITKTSMNISLPVDTDTNSIANDTINLEYSPNPYGSDWRSTNRRIAHFEITYNGKPVLEDNASFSEMTPQVYIYNEFVPILPTYTTDLEFRVKIPEGSVRLTRNGSAYSIIYEPYFYYPQVRSTTNKPLCDYPTYLEFEIGYKGLVNSVAKKVSVTNCI